MSVHDFFYQLDRWEERKKYFEEKYKGFSGKLPGELIKVVFEHLPEINNKREEKLKAVQKIATNFVEAVWEAYNMANWCNANNDSVSVLHPVRKPGTKQEAQKKLQKEIQNIPKEHWNEYEVIFWEMYEETYKRESYEYAVFMKTKEVFAEFYFDEVLELESKYLRYFERTLGLDICDFLEDVYQLAD